VKELSLIPKALPFGFKPVEWVGFATLAHQARNYCHPGRSRGIPWRKVQGDFNGILDYARDDDKFERVTLLLATRNPNKTLEFAQLLGRDFCVRDLTLDPGIPEIIESGTTFEENAVLKAVTMSKIFPNEIVVADDSGLEVKALGGAPGIFSARYAGENASDRRNVEKLLRELQDARDRSARFYCVIAVAKNGELMTTVTGEVAGTIAKSPRGENGFGYDPVFAPNGFSQTFAELTPETKNNISHRAQAAAALVEYFQCV
jgi:non-canonical purine NTP pyrophosphatase (RdgB/HAM1 family)